MGRPTPARTPGKPGATGVGPHPGPGSRRRGSLCGMNTTTTPTTRRGPVGAVLGPLSMIAGPTLIALALVTLHEPWRDDVPDYQVVDNEHGLLMLSFNLAAAAFPFLFGSVVPLATAARRTPRLA